MERVRVTCNKDHPKDLGGTIVEDIDGNKTLVIMCKTCLQRTQADWENYLRTR